MNYLTLTILILNFASCSLISNKDGPKQKEIGLVKYQSMSSNDYADHLKAFEDFYLESPSVSLRPLLKSEKSYLESIGDEIVKNNELFFTSGLKPQFKVVESEVPFHFSLPGLKVFISTGLVAKYLKNEKLLYSVVAYELIRSEKKIYKKAHIVPTGFMPTSRALALLRLNTSEKVETHKWAYYTLKRVGVDADIYLSWLQIQNRNSADFAMQLGDTSSISREESLFKAFIIQNSKKKSGGSKYERSSRAFYAFVNRIKR